MLIRYIGPKEVKRDTVNDPQTTYVWEAANGYVVDVKPEHAGPLLKHELVWVKDESPKDESPKDESPKDESPKDESPKDESPRSPPQKGPAASGK